MGNARRLREIMRFTLITLVVGGLLAVVGPVPKAWAPTAVEYAVMAINAKTGQVTLKNVATGRTFNVEIPNLIDLQNKALLGKLKVGQNVQVDVLEMKAGAKGSLKLAGGETVGFIITGTRPAAPVKARQSPVGPVDASRFGPVDGIITAIDHKTGVVTGKELGTGKLFQFEIKDQAALGSIKIGEKVGVDHLAQKVSVSGYEALTGLKIIGSGAGR